jgi:hypothetical protein
MFKPATTKKNYKFHKRDKVQEEEFICIPHNTFIITVMLTGGNFPFPVPINNILFVWVLQFV